MYDIAHFLRPDDGVCVKIQTFPKRWISRHSVRLMQKFVYAFTMGGWLTPLRMYVWMYDLGQILGVGFGVSGGA